MLTAGAVILALALEVVVGEPPARLHPVSWLGRVVAPADRAWPAPRFVGGLVAAAVPLGVGGTVAGLVILAARPDAVLALVAAGGALFLATSLRMLVSAARDVIAASATDLDRAREALPALVGRDPTTLSAGQVRSAAVESAAENLADGLVAPLAAFAVAGLLAQPLGPTATLALAAGAAAWVKAVNTLDSMLGYRSKPVGWAPARLDDLVMWLPARATALLLALVSGRPRSVARARDWLDGVPSPNAGWPMGTMAAAADVRLAKPGVHVLNEDADLPSVAAATVAVRTVGLAGLLAYGLAAGTLALAEGVPWS